MNIYKKNLKARKIKIGDIIKNILKGFDYIWDIRDLKCNRAYSWYPKLPRKGSFLCPNH